jgi:two-component system response regulator WspF
MRIGIVNDLKLACEALRRVVQSEPGHEVAWTAADGREAVERATRDRPDLILMDLIMPKLDGVEATRQIMRQAPCPILVVTSSVSGNIGKVYEAMGLGALDAVDTPVLGANGRVEGGGALLRKIGYLKRLIGAELPQGVRLGDSSASFPAITPPNLVEPLLLLGASTGGPKAVAQILGGLPPSLPAGVIVVQHVDASFAPGLVRWLRDQSPLPVEVITPGCRPAAGKVLVAQTNDHLVMTADRTLTYSAEPSQECYRPSVDVFFQSVAKRWPRPGVAVVLTGMGRDGAEGLAALRRAGWHTIAQDEASSIVFGMPRAAIERGAAAQVLSPSEMAPVIVTKLRSRLGAN